MKMPAYATLNPAASIERLALTGSKTLNNAQATTTSRAATTSRPAMARRNSVSEPAIFAAVSAALSSTTRRSTTTKYPKAPRIATGKSAIPAVVLALRISGADIIEEGP